MQHRFVFPTKKRHMWLYLATRTVNTLCIQCISSFLHYMHLYFNKCDSIQLVMLNDTSASDALISKCRNASQTAVRMKVTLKVGLFDSVFSSCFCKVPSSGSWQQRMLTASCETKTNLGKHGRFEGKLNHITASMLRVGLLNVYSHFHLASDPASKAWQNATVTS